jgi:hypothetical protein
MEADKSKPTRPELDDLKETKSYFGDLHHTLSVGIGKIPQRDKLPEHFERLRFVSRQLDQVPQEFWRAIYKGSPTMRRRLPYFPMQTLLWGQEGVFNREAEMYEIFLGDSPANASRQRRGDEDHAQQCFRIMDAYLQLKEQRDLFEEHGLTFDIEDF